MASITCGECGGTHASVQEVKSCYADDQYDEAAERGLAEAERINSQSFCGELRLPDYWDNYERDLEAWAA